MLGNCGVIQNGRHIGAILDFSEHYKLSKHVKNWKFFYAGHVEYDIIKHFAAVC